MIGISSRKFQCGPEHFLCMRVCIQTWQRVVLSKSVSFKVGYLTQAYKQYRIIWHRTKELTSSVFTPLRADYSPHVHIYKNLYSCQQHFSQSTCCLQQTFTQKWRLKITVQKEIIQLLIKQIFQRIRDVSQILDIQFLDNCSIDKTLSCLPNSSTDV